MRVIGDLTLNHTGIGHEWFRPPRTTRARRARLLLLRRGAAARLRVAGAASRSLPKLNSARPTCARRMPAVVRRGSQPYGLDGWRIDVANMAGRYRGVDLDARRRPAAARGREAAARRAARRRARTRLPRRPRGGGWHGTMNYAGFMRPAWQWLHGDAPEELRSSFWGFPVGLPRLDGRQAAATMRAFRAGVPWPGDPPLLGAARQPRQRALPHGRRLPRAAASSGSACR